MVATESQNLTGRFEEFLKTITDKSGQYIYRNRISQMISSGQKSLVIDFGDLLRFDDELANRLLLKPDETLESLRSAAYEAIRSESPVYADAIRKALNVRIRGLPDQVPLRKVDTSYLEKMISIAGMVVRTSELRPLMVEGAFVCPNNHVTYQLQNDAILKRPIKCETCDETRNFELDRRLSRFIDFQILRIQELPEELPPGQLPQFFDVNVEGDLVNTARPGDRVVLTGIVRAVPDYTQGQVRMRLFKSQIDCNHIEVRGKEPEQVQITKEDEALIRSIATSPNAYQNLVRSIAPAIHGHEAEKEAILLLLAGGTTTHLPDGTRLRGEINVLFVGDPGCLTAGEKVVLSDGSIVRIEEIGNEHLQPIFVEVFTGEQSQRAAYATTFHKYVNQPILEIVTEKGKSLRGTYNHPVLVAQKEKGVSVWKWKRLDQLKVGDMIATCRYIPCSIKKLQPANFKFFEHKENDVLKLPEFVDTDLASFLGYSLGSGIITDEGVTLLFRYDTRHIAEEMMRRAIKLFGKKKVEFERDSKQGVEISIKSRNVASNLKSMLNGRVPSSILKSSNNIVSEFLRWLFEAKGYVKKERRGCKVILEGFELELLRDIQILLLRWGIDSKVAKDRLEIFGSSNLGLFAANIGFLSNEKCRILIRFKKKANVEIKGFGSEKIASITPRPPENVFDIEVPGMNMFVANGLISHNTAKSEMLKFAAQVAPRGIFASGKGTTAAGLSAAVIREKNVLMLEAGVVVLADQGIACLHPDTRVIYNNSIIRISDIANEANFVKVLSRNGLDEVAKVSGELKSFDLSEKVFKKGNAKMVRRRWHNGKLQRMRFSSGRSILVTEDHLLLDGESFCWKNASSFDVGECVVAFGDESGWRRCLDQRQEAYGLNSVLLQREVYKLEKLISVDSIQYTGYVYDIVMDKYHNFVAEGIVVHNCIDEFDKMREEDRSALHEQMEQQSVTVAKGGIYATLNARTAILAATNPILGKYNPYQNLTDNISLPIPLLTRFDLIFVIKDIPTPAEDEKLATHILSVHAKRGYDTPPPIEFSLLKKYIAYAKKVNPVLTKPAMDRIKEYYLELRRRGAEGQITATPRALESLIRLATARARLLLRQEVLEEDALEAIALMNKMVEDVLTDTATKTKADFGILLGRPAGERSKLATALEVLKRLEGEERKPVERKVFVDELIKTGKFTEEDAERIIGRMFKEGLIYESKPGFFRRVGG
jgi:DNA replicative helicase MCM subunit Mcm2 (Cdc46/Mcm family)